MPGFFICTARELESIQDACTDEIDVDLVADAVAHPVAFPLEARADVLREIVLGAGAVLIADLVLARRGIGERSSRAGPVEQIARLRSLHANAGEQYQFVLPNRQAADRVEVIARAVLVAAVQSAGRRRRAVEREVA